MDVYVITTAMQNGLVFTKLDENKKRLGLTAIIARLYSLKGMGEKAVILDDKTGKPSKPSPEVLLAVEELTIEVNQKYPFLTMSEIKLALESGVKGELDDQPNILCVANYCRWLSIYRRSEARTEAKQLIENEKRITSHSNCLEYGTVESRNDVALRILYKQLKDEVLEKGRIDEAHMDYICAIVYDWCRKTGEMPRPEQSDINHALALVRSARTSRTQTESMIIRQAKRILLEGYLKKS